MQAKNKNATVTLAGTPAVGTHRDGGTMVVETTDGRYAVVTMKPNKSGNLRLINVFADKLRARRYNFAIHGDKLGE
jgi:hypothetical protein